jgi:acyl-coenzyme A thioesterase PaaI-like protein
MDEQGTTAGAAADELGAGLVQLGEGLPFNRHLGVLVDHLEPGRCRTRLPADDRLANHLGGVHAIAELAPVELAGALAASTRLAPLLERGYVPVVGGLEVRYRAPARGDLVATATVGEEAVAPALAAADAGERPRVTVTVEVTDEAGTVVTVAELRFVYLTVAAEPAG